jgi:dihydrofolate synthase/folylpolyglutamate synthase
MGGRLDSTNVIDPLATCITTIDFDHEQYLGRTLARIAGEKAGIIKAGVPVLCGRMTASALRTIKRVAASRRAPVFEIGEHAAVTLLKTGRTGSEFEYRGLGPRRRLSVSLLGSHQVSNAAIAVLAAEVLKGRGLKIPDRAIEEGLKRAKWPGRLQVLSRHPFLVADGAHNISGARALTRSLAEIDVEKPLVVFGVLRDKNCGQMLDLLARRAGGFIFTRPAYHRALPLTDLRATADGLGIKAAGFARVDRALKHALARAGGDQAILVCGSLYLVGEAMQALGYRPERARLC